MTQIKAPTASRANVRDPALRPTVIRAAALLLASPDDANGRQQDNGAGKFAWALFDWPFTTRIITFVFSAYFAILIVGDQGATLSSLGVYSSDLRIPLDAFTAGLARWYASVIGAEAAKVAQ